MIQEIQLTKISDVFDRTKLQFNASCILEKHNNLKLEKMYETNREGYLYYYKKFTANPKQFLTNRFLDIGTWANALYLYKENLIELRKQFQFKVRKTLLSTLSLSLKEETMLSAKRALHNVTIDSQWAVPNTSITILYIGVHVR